MTKNTPFLVGIVGLGQIAQGYDEPDSSTISTHLKACQENPQLRVAWICDVDTARAEEVRRRWNLTADIVSSKDAPNHSVDIACIASPDETHPQWIERFLENPPKLILCEKPLSVNVERSRSLISKVQAAHSVLVINFMRRWIPGVTPWLRAAAAGGFGAPKRAQLTYCRGLHHSACHGLDIIGAALGGDVVSVARSGNVIFDFNENDPTVSAMMQVRAADGPVPILIRGVDSRLDYIFDFEIIYNTSRMHVWNDDGIRVRISDENNNFISEFHDKPARYMQYVWENLIGVLSDRMKPVFDVSGILPGASLIEAVAGAPVPAAATSAP
jgi:predicted dehydrogenase